MGLELSGGCGGGLLHDRLKTELKRIHFQGLLPV
jgi:hypothetical protein